MGTRWRYSIFYNFGRSRITPHQEAWRGCACYVESWRISTFGLERASKSSAAGLRNSNISWVSAGGARSTRNGERRTVRRSRDSSFQWLLRGNDLANERSPDDLQQRMVHLAVRLTVSDLLAVRANPAVGCGWRHAPYLSAARAAREGV
jgi:hypothetical protein